MRFIIADDKYECRQILRAALVADLGFECVGEAENAHAALALCRKLRPDGALLDVNMPPGDGMTVAQTIVEEQLARIVVMVTKQAQMKDRALALGCGFVAKPFGDRVVLANEIRRTVKRVGNGAD